MGPGFKYHIATISAIFFALAIGLVVGSLYLSAGVAARQTNAIEQLKKTLVQQNASLNQQVSRDEQFIRDITPVFLKDKLAGEPVAIVQTGDYPDATSEARQALDLAGAHILSVTTIRRARPDQVIDAQLSTLHAQDPRFPASREGLINVVAGILAHGDSPDKPLIQVLEDKDFLAKSPDSDYTTGARYVVIVAGSSDEASNLHVADVDQPLITALQNRGVTVVACEEQNVQVPDINTYNASNPNLRMVEDVKSDIGHCTLVMALKEAREENGGKPASASTSPPLQLGQDAGPQK